MKEIAAELNFDDEHYFSRYIKKHTGISPTVIRETVGIAQIAYSPMWRMDLSMARLLGFEVFWKKMNPMLDTVVNVERTLIHFMRISIFIVMAWIGGLKAFQYEADGIVPFVANSPLMSFFYNKKAPEYQSYKNPE